MVRLKTLKNPAQGVALGIRAHASCRPVRAMGNAKNTE